MKLLITHAANFKITIETSGTFEEAIQLLLGSGTYKQDHYIDKNSAFLYDAATGQPHLIEGWKDYD